MATDEVKLKDEVPGGIIKENILEDVINPGIIEEEITNDPDDIIADLLL
jgi:hypothetical protein